MNERRPDPINCCIASVRRKSENARAAQDLLRSCTGVGKTYAMLEAARQKRAEGVEIVAGLVETHGRKETEALLEGLEVLPAEAWSTRNALKGVRSRRCLLRSP